MDDSYSRGRRSKNSAFYQEESAQLSDKIQ